MASKSKNTIPEEAKPETNITSEEMRSDLKTVFDETNLVVNQFALITEEDRTKVFESSRYKCSNCGSQKSLEVAHIQPRSKRGVSKPPNLLCLCHQCHQRSHGSEGSVWTLERLRDLKAKPWAVLENNANEFSKIEIVASMTFTDFDEVKIEWLRRGLANFLGVNVEQIRIGINRKGSIIIPVLIPISTVSVLLVGLNDGKEELMIVFREIRVSCIRIGKLEISLLDMALNKQIRDKSKHDLIKTSYISHYAVVIYFDIVGFTKGGDLHRQAEIIIQMVEHFRKKYPHAGRMLHQIRLSPPDMLFSPSGDGMAIAIYGDRLSGNVALDVLDDVMEYAKIIKKQIRCGIHAGALLVYEDINNSAGFCGTAVNMAKRIMDIAEDQILCSNTAYREVLADAIDRHPSWECSPSEIYYVKHGDRVHVRNLWRSASSITTDKSIPDRSSQIADTQVGSDGSEENESGTSENSVADLNKKESNLSVNFYKDNSYGNGNKKSPSHYLSGKFEFHPDGYPDPREDLLNAKKIVCIALKADNLSKKLVEYYNDENYRHQIKWKSIEFCLPEWKFIEHLPERKPQTEQYAGFRASIENILELEQIGKKSGFDVFFRSLPYLPFFGVLGLDCEDQSVGVIRTTFFIPNKFADDSPIAVFNHPTESYLPHSDYGIFLESIKFAQKHKSEVISDYLNKIEADAPPPENSEKTDIHQKANPSRK